MPVTPTAGDLQGAVIAAVAATAHGFGNRASGNRRDRGDPPDAHRAGPLVRPCSRFLMDPSVVCRGGYHHHRWSAGRGATPFRLFLAMALRPR